MDNNRKFRERYVVMEKKIRKEFNLHPSKSLYSVFNESGYRKFSDIFDVISKIRNEFSHTNMENYITVNDEAIKNVEMIISYIDSPPKVIDNCVLLKDMFTADINDKILEKIKFIKEKKYNSIPIVNDNKLIGLFLEDTITNKIIEEEIIEITSETTFSDFNKYVDLKNKNIMFIQKNMNINELYKLHKKNFNSKKYIEFYFITSNGDSESKLLGMITSQRIATLEI